MINKEDILDIELKEEFDVFCNSQKNCDECILVKKDIVFHAYDQPCQQVYDLIKMVKEK